MADNVIFKFGTKAEFDRIQEKDPFTLYWITDKKALYKGDELFGVGAAASEDEDGLLSAEDKKRLNELVEGGVAGLTPVDASIVIAPGLEGGKTVGVKISGKEHNALRLEDDGLYAEAGVAANVPEYELELKDDAGEYLAVYRLKRTVNGESTYPGAEIRIPKDKVIKGGEVKTVQVQGVPYEGAEVGDPYFDIVLANDGETHVYLPAKGIIDPIEAGDGILLEGGKVSVAPVYEKAKYEAVGLLEGARFDVSGREIRVMFPANAPFKQPTGQADGRDNNCYYMGIRFFAPSDDVTGFKEGNETADGEMENFEGPSSGVDKYGRKYDICWFPVARTEDNGGSWTYLGAGSTPGRCAGWYHTIEWYAGDKCVGSETVRVNLTNESCHNSLIPSLGTSNRPEGVILWEEMK